MFEYIIEKIKNTQLRQKPFPHLYIENFLSPEHFQRVIESAQIDIDLQNSTEDLISMLQSKDYSPEPFPGCTTSIEHYLDWYNSPTSAQRYENDLLEGFGIAFRMRKYHDSFLEDLVDFLNSDDFHKTIKDKFQRTGNTRIETAIQKYLSGYEISPHPDIRKKCLTYMVNINTDDSTEQMDLHTHLMEFDHEHNHLYQFWRDNLTVDRCWVPWSWCETRFLHQKNNSIVMFAPDDDTLHAVKLDYDHLKLQRTQIYGNLWYRKGSVPAIDRRPNWKQLDHNAGKIE
jgi:hypothetical protein